MNATEAARDAVTEVSKRHGVPLELSASGTLIVRGVAVPLPEKLTGEDQALFGIGPLFPNVPRGDDRDKLLWRVAADAVPGGAQLLSDRDLERKLPDLIGLPGAAGQAAADVLLDRFFNRKKVRVLLPAHSSLPANYAHTTGSGREARYRMFSGGILPFLLWDVSVGGIDTGLLQRLLDYLADDSELTALDRRFLRAALEGAPRPQARPDATALVEDYRPRLEQALMDAGGPFCSPSLDRFRADLETVLDVDLPRTDKLAWLTLLVSLHISVRMYRIALVRGMQLDLAVAAAGDLDPPAGARSCPCSGDAALQDCPLAGRIRFRTASGAYRPVSQRDACRGAFVELDQRRLLDLPATLVTATLASHAWSALGGGEPAARRDVPALTAAISADAQLRSDFNAVCAAIAAMHHDAFRGASRDRLLEASRTAPNRPGLHALREEVRTSRRRDLRHQSRDVVNQLMLSSAVAGPGSLISRNGTVGYFEVDEQLLLLLTLIVTRREPTAYEAFLHGLAAYGLAPQDESEERALADALERLGLLVRFSDSGEASFVAFGN